LLHLLKTEFGTAVTSVSYILKLIFKKSGSQISPAKYLHLVVVVELVRLCDPESNAGGSLTTSRATHAGKVKERPRHSPGG
jgi:hypothetical protein